VLEGTSHTVANFGPDGKTAVYSLESFASTKNGSCFLDSDGKWLGEPGALLTGSLESTRPRMAILILSAPIYHNAARVTRLLDVLTFRKPSVVIMQALRLNYDPMQPAEDFA
jgi:hypothetical protein